MIESLTITGTPPFTSADPTRFEPRKLNYIFGTNGVGKTTISRIIANPNRFPTCSLAWKGGSPLHTLVLNRDFVAQNFAQLNGIFTLGERDTAIEEKINAATDARQQEIDRRNALRRTLSGDDGTGGKQAELTALEAEIRDKCWEMKEKYDAVFKDAFHPNRNVKQNFKQHLLEERTSNQSALKPYAELASRAATVFGAAPVKATRLALIDASALVAHEADPILGKKVIGKEDVDIAAMIKRLGNVDWVRQGREFYAVNDGACPFCQQQTTAAFAASLEGYFDETYQADKRAIDELVRLYATDATSVQESVKRICDEPGDFIDLAQLTAQQKMLDEILRTNRLLLDNKKAAPSAVVALQPLAPKIEAIATLINTANSAIDSHNATVDNLASERTVLKSEVWRYVVNEIEPDLKRFDVRKDSLQKAIAGLREQITAAETNIGVKDNEIRELERQTTSIQPTVDAINETLARFGFDGFKLAVAPNGRSYQLVRISGEPVGETLSEGERTFVVFLYFYHLVQGSWSDTGITADRVVVFDDPVSSLDSDVLFIVSCLIRSVCENAREGRGHVKQVLVLTHNVFFFREVAYKAEEKFKNVDRLFAVVRKRAGVSMVTVADMNPIKSSYELLWAEVRNADTNDPRLPNTLRRILEYYFAILGDAKLDHMHEHFDGQDKLICRSLLAWANAGSHHVFDDLYVVPSDTACEGFLRVFRAVFECSGQIAHYNMMIGGAPIDGSDEGSPPGSAISDGG